MPLTSSDPTTAFARSASLISDGQAWKALLIKLTASASCWDLHLMTIGKVGWPWAVLVNGLIGFDNDKNRRNFR